MLDALLTPEDVGPGFTGGAPTIDEEEDEEGDGVASEPTCGIRDDTERLVQASVGPLVTPEGEQVFERLSVAEDPERAIQVQRDRAAAQCQFEEAVETTTYTVEVHGPVELDEIADEAVGMSLIYSGGYEGHRWDMLARSGRVLINIQYTSTTEIDPARANELLALAVEKASRL